ncbi:hypothetical protein SAMN04488135_103273 [Pollutimonas bauzanensis]|uniref:Uncharacterized protein n=1 Tax=Pollutimonas bauzanensis TaxID=658167 RepID=A0A1M5T551_9BURK|nr:hypothetical protein SAMN04488135_103273 [Pollutimonas bauzanensis]
MVALRGAGMGIAPIASRLLRMPAPRPQYVLIAIKAIWSYII